MEILWVVLFKTFEHFVYYYLHLKHIYTYPIGEMNTVKVSLENDMTISNCLCAFWQDVLQF